MNSARRPAALVSAMALVLALAVVPSSGAGTTKKGSPYDLKITQVKVEDLPTPQYVLLNHSSRAPEIQVTVTTFNYGAHVGPTQTELKLELNGKVFAQGHANVPPLDYRQSIDHTWTIRGQKADPGLLEIVAIADATHKVDEKNERNNINAAPIIPVIAQTWNVSAFQANVDLGNGLSGATQTANGFTYEFDHVDPATKEFVYTANGEVDSITNFSQSGCSGQGKATDTQTPWPGGQESDLFLKYNLSQYSAGVKTDGEPPYMYTVTCGQTQFQEQGNWENLVTFQTDHSWIPMKFDQTTISDHGHVNSPTGYIKYNWIFNAALSGA